MGAAVRIRMDGIISSFFPSVFQTTKLKIKTGLVLLQKESRYAPSCGEICFVCVRSAEILAPIGYPQRKPAMIAKLPFGETRKILFRRGPNRRAIRRMQFGGHQQVCDDQKRETVWGKTVWNHSSRPLLAPLNTSFGNKSIKTKQIRTPIPGQIFFS